ncbi:exodeoxyribonuclease 7 large subunit-like [Acropora muricata]|uniref:exodeoxyribonuclease 7 large subunit-like n=1 Tax=Acropora muricata TaxID=159855 RepID=UPI0034E5C0BA
MTPQKARFFTPFALTSPDRRGSATFMFRRSNAPVGTPRTPRDRTGPDRPWRECGGPGPRVIRVGDLAGILRNTLERRFPRVAVAGEISNLVFTLDRVHAYFTVKDRRASLACVLFAEHRSRLDFAPEDGQEVVVTGRVTFYRKSGQLQLSAEHVEPVGLGALMAEYAARARALSAEGLFAPDRKKRVPRYVRTVGVGDSRDGAALYDVIRNRPPPGSARPIVVSETTVQGKSACFHIVRALARLERLRECDVILLVRGGGSLEDLWAFNEEPLVRAVAASATPIIAGVGHESDTTLVDLAAGRPGLDAHRCGRAGGAGPPGSGHPRRRTRRAAHPGVRPQPRPYSGPPAPTRRAPSLERPSPGRAGAEPWMRGRPAATARCAVSCWIGSGGSARPNEG